jgi:DNA mismatch endonuclease (patch repair protein)
MRRLPARRARGGIPMTRSELMSRIRSVSRAEREAGPVARRLAGCPLAHQPKGVFGRPDYANKRRRLAIFIDGDFWHKGPAYKEPKTNVEFWREKVRRNRARRRLVRRRLRAEGWRVLEYWESELKVFSKLMNLNRK